MANRKRTSGYNLKSYSNSEREATTRRLATYLRGLATRRSDGIVTADDVHTYLTRDGVNVGQIRTRLSFINSVFGSGMFEQVGMVPSARPQAKRRAISAWTLA